MIGVMGNVKFSKFFMFNEDIGAKITVGFVKIKIRYCWE